MKKFGLILLCVILSLVCAFSFLGCNGDNKNKNNNGNGSSYGQNKDNVIEDQGEWGRLN